MIYKGYSYFHFHATSWLFMPWQSIDLILFVDLCNMDSNMQLTFISIWNNSISWCIILGMFTVDLTFMLYLNNLLTVCGYKCFPFKTYMQTYFFYIINQLIFGIWDSFVVFVKVLQKSVIVVTPNNTKKSQYSYSTSTQNK